MKQLKKIKHLWTVLAQSSVIDAATNSLSIHNVLEQVQVGKKGSHGESIIPEKGEGVPLNLQVISLWQRVQKDKGELSLEGELQVIDPEGEILSSNNFPIIIQESKERTRSIANFQGFKVTVPGEYIFKLRVREDKKEKFMDVDEAYLLIQFVLR